MLMLGGFMGKIKLTSVDFAGTKEQEAELRKMLKELKGTDGALMPALQKAQGIYGYLPIEVQKIVSEELGVPLEKIFGVVTFYTQFLLNPNGKYDISVCLGTACYVKGAGDVIEKIQNRLDISPGDCTSDLKFSLNATRCIGCCGLAPVMTINGEVFGKVKADEVDAILDKFKD